MICLDIYVNIKCINNNKKKKTITKFQISSAIIFFQQIPFEKFRKKLFKPGLHIQYWF